MFVSATSAADGAPKWLSVPLGKAAQPFFRQPPTLVRARRLLEQGASALAAPDRPHDLKVILAVARADEIQAGGAGMALHAGIAVSPFGHCLIGESARGICHLSFFDPGDRDKAIADMHAEWPRATVVWNDEAAASLSEILFERAPVVGPPVPWQVFVGGTPFQLCVWRALLRVPAGTLVSYGALAAAAGNPQAARATGTAVARNPIAFLIPCHRVIRETGAIGGYRWGAVRKRAMLAWEGAPGGGTDYE
jgi:AraC family transcriptional regulator of adaptative response/methylated-DNA-[protein]-cysteine methyltransferase